MELVIRPYERGSEMRNKTNSYLFIRQIVRIAKEVLGLALLILELIQRLFNLLN